MIDLSTVKSSSTPKYIQIAKTIRTQIRDGEIATGDALPSERDLCDLTGASRVTIRKAVDQLIDEGLLRRKQGSGTFVAERIEMPATYLGGFTEDTKARGEAPGSIWLVKNYANPTREEAAKLHVSASSETQGNRPQRGRQTVRASLASPTEAGLLSIQENSEVLRIERVTWLDDGTPIEFTRSAYRGDRYEFVTDIR